MKRKHLQKQRGFTLTEIIVTIIIIGVLASLALPRFGGVFERVRASEGAHILTALLRAQKAYRVEFGVYSTAGGILPRQMKDVYELFQKGRVEEARDLHMKLQVVNRFLEYDPGYVSPAKEALNMLGLPGGISRRPTPDLTVKQKEELREALRQIGALK